ncbi:MAG: transposase [Nitrososphaerota archaeon]|nr:transposase [Nitrososphaerota archaeon]
MPFIYRSVIQRSDPTPKARELLAVFPSMVNDCLRAGLEKKMSDFPRIKELCWPRMREYRVHDSYRVSAMFDAANLIKKFQTDSKRTRAGLPRVSNEYFSASLGVYLEAKELLLPGNIRTPLNGHTLAVLRAKGVEVVSATMTQETCSVIYRKFVQGVAPQGMVAVDLNLDNVTTFDTEGESIVYDTSALSQIHEAYRRVKSHFRRNDARMKGTVWRKYARLEHDRKLAVLHSVSSEIVKRAAAKKQAIVMEDLRWLRDMYRRRSGYSAYYLSKMNAWPFRQILHQLAYKAEWLGLPVVTIDPDWTSEKCCECDGLMEVPPVEGIVVCSVCGNAIDRHLNGAKNILRRGLRSGPGWSAGEAVTGSNLPGWETRARVDADNPASQR